MIEIKECVMCNEKISIINCHYICPNCGFGENCHDKPHLIDEIKDCGLDLFLPIIATFVP